MSLLHGKQIRNGTISSDKLAEGATAPLKELQFSTVPILTVVEAGSETDINGVERITVNITVQNIDVINGRLADIIVYAKRSHEDIYEEFSTRHIPEQTTGVSWNAILTIKTKPELWDFKAIYLSGTRYPASTAGSVIESLSLNQRFNGIPDIYEYVEVPELEATNTEDPKSGHLPGQIIDLKMTDLRFEAKQDKSRLPADVFFPVITQDAFGDSYTTQAIQAEKLTRYILYMFISKEGLGPANPYPGVDVTFNAVMYDEAEWDYNGVHKEDPNGTWVLVGEYATPFAVGVRVPPGKTVYFWAGFKSDATQTKVETDKIVY